MKIKDICTSVTDGSHNPPQGIEKSEYMMLSSKNIFDDEITFDEPRFLSEKDFEREHKRTKIAVGDVLLTIVGTVGRTAVVDEDMPAFALQRSVAVLHPKNDVCLPRFLMYALRGKRTYIANRAKGVAQKGIYLKEVSDIDIYIPDISNQEIIINKLDKVNAIIKLRQEELLALDNLIKARFVEMFGDPIQNPKGWDMPLIEEVVANEKNALKAGPFGSALKKEYYVASGYKIYGQEQVISDDCTFGDYYIDEERYKSLENCAVQPGDVLISLVGTYGKLLIMPEVFEPGIINPRLMKITFDKEKVNPYYFKFFFQSESLKKALSQNTHGGTMDILNLGIVRKIEMPLPPLKLQNEFVAFVHQVDKSKVAVQKALDETQMLFDSLMQEYFG